MQAEDFNYNASVFSVFLFPLLCLLPSTPSLMYFLLLDQQRESILSFPLVILLLRRLGESLQPEKPWKYGLTENVPSWVEADQDSVVGPSQADVSPPGSTVGIQECS